MKNGEGEFTQADGYKYSGSWRDNKRNGFGTCVNADTSVYTG